MEPRLKLILKGNPEEELMLLLRINPPFTLPQNVKVVSQFGDIISCRILRKHLSHVYNSTGVKSIKAPRVLPMQTVNSERNILYSTQQKTKFGSSNPSVLSNVVFGIIDFGFDFTHLDFTNKDNLTRFEAMWLQNQNYDGQNIYGYGRVVQQDDINEALAADFPFEYLDYHPGEKDILSMGMHGTHVLGIAASSGKVGKKGGAAHSPIIAVDMGSNFVNGADISLGDSVKLIEGLDFILKSAGNRPVVINMSIGGHGDSHTGSSLVELAMDNLLANRKGTAIVQSTGNYFNVGCHSQKLVEQNDSVELDWKFKEGDSSPNELEIWYDGADELAIELYSDKGLKLGVSYDFADTYIYQKDEKIGVIFHRKHEPNTMLNHVNIIIEGKLEFESLLVKIIGKKIVKGMIHAYIERDDRGQSCFEKEDVSPLSTTGSICNGKYTIAVGAYNQSSPCKEVLGFSSSGPTLFGKMKPELLAPGYKISAALSASKKGRRAQKSLTEKTGSSMAAPYVAGLIVRLLEMLPNQTIHQIRKRLFASCLSYICLNKDEKHKTGYGYISPILLLKN